MKKLFYVAAVCGLSACAAGETGGGGSTQFQSFSALASNDNKTTDGQTRSYSYTADRAGNLTRGRTERFASDDTAQIGTTNGNLTSMSINAGSASVAFDVTRGDTVQNLGTHSIFITANGEDRVIAVDPAGNGYDYQTAATWLTGVGTGSGQMASGSFGARTTDASGVPATATYTGQSVGVFEGRSTNAYAFAPIQMNVDFQGGTYQMNVMRGADTQLADIYSGTTSNARLLDFSSSGTVTGTSMNGSISAPAGVSGTMTADLYGPNGEEVGGTFSMTGRGTYVGAFGAKR